MADITNELAKSVGVESTTTHLGIMWYVSLAIMAIQAVLYLMAFSQLKEHKKSGWNLLYYAFLLGIVAGVTTLLTDTYGAHYGIVGSIIGAVIGWFFLFQSRSQFNR